MAIDFAALEARVAAASIRHLANANVLINGQSIRGIFDSSHAMAPVGAVGIAGLQPTVTVLTSAITGDPVGQAVVVSGHQFVCAAHEPDGSGMSVLLLERAS